MWQWHVSIMEWDEKFPFRIEGRSWPNTRNHIIVNRYPNWDKVRQALEIVAHEGDTIHIHPNLEDI